MINETATKQTARREALEEAVKALRDARRDLIQHLSETNGETPIPWATYGFDDATAVLERQLEAEE